jgi:hypothetical protein
MKERESRENVNTIVARLNPKLPKALAVANLS